jgi:alpha-methylacyl-CoA racemase
VDEFAERMIPKGLGGHPGNTVTSSALAGVLVADLTLNLPGPFATRELLQLGARVAKIEPPTGDPMAALFPGQYEVMNMGKELLRWDAKREPPPPELCEADVIVEGFRPGVWEKLCPDVREDAIVCSITGYGHGGFASVAGHDLNYLGYAGVLEDVPVVPPIQIADLAGGAQRAVIQILGALRVRDRTGDGSRIVVSMMHASHRFVAHRCAGEPVPRLLTGGVACYRIYRTADERWLTVAALEPKFWQRLCELLERPDFVGRQLDPGIPELAELFYSRPLRAWSFLFEDENTCVGPVLTLAEAAQALGEPEAG